MLALWLAKRRLLLISRLLCLGCRHRGWLRLLLQLRLSLCCCRRHLQLLLSLHGRCMATQLRFSGVTSRPRRWTICLLLPTRLLLRWAALLSGRQGWLRRLLRCRLSHLYILRTCLRLLGWLLLLLLGGLLLLSSEPCPRLLLLLPHISTRLHSDPRRLLLSCCWLFIGLALCLLPLLLGWRLHLLISTSSWHASRLACAGCGMVGV